MGPLTERIVETFDHMPAQMRAAARYVLERPRDVALLSMREQARQAEVKPATMTRFAQRLGFDGYEAVRALYADAIRSGGLGFAGKADAQVARQKRSGDRALASDMIASLKRQIERLEEPTTLDAIAEAAAMLASAERIFCLGLRACHPVAWNLQYVLSLLGERVILLDAVAGVGADPIRSATAKDVLFAVSVEPYTRATIEAARYAVLSGLPVVALTDSAVSPLARIARRTILVSTEGPSFFHSMTPAFFAGEILAAIVAGRGGEDSLRALRRSETQLQAFRVHWSPKDDRIA